MKISEIIIKLKNYHPVIDESHTTDVVKFGDIQQECTGIVTTVCATVEVIRKTAELGANLIIVHEPLFYSDEDQQDWLEDNSVYQEKKQLLQDAGIVVWRDHDRLHGGNPKRIRSTQDLVFFGIMRELGWEEYYIGDLQKPLLYEFPEAVSAKQLMQELLEKLNLSGARIVGNQNAAVKKVFFCEHINGKGWAGRESDQEVIQEIEIGDYDAIIPFEIVDWTLSAYIRDAAQLGRNKVLIEMGHFNVEELAMRYMAKWLPEVLEQKVNVQFVQAGDNYSYYLVKK